MIITSNMMFCAGICLCECTCFIFEKKSLRYVLVGAAVCAYSTWRVLQSSLIYVCMCQNRNGSNLAQTCSNGVLENIQGQDLRKFK